MTFRGFLKDKWLLLLCQAVMIAAVSIILLGLGFSAGGSLFICSCLLLALLLPLWREYFKKRSYYRSLCSSLDQLDQKQLLASVLEAPDFIEGEILYDVLKQTQKAMNDEIASYRHREEEYHDYVETWVHEVKLPISCAELICANNKNGVTDSIREELDRIEGYVEQTLYYARSLNLEKDYSIRRLSLEELVKAAVKRQAKQLIAVNMRIQLEKLSLSVYSDPKWLDFILGQLISNSIKYRSAEPVLLFSAEDGRDNVLLHIRDNGIGIAEHEIGRIFEKGFTGQNGRRFAKSTGIGLYLCRQLCNKMNLRIEAQSELGEGTAITIIFPKDSRALLQ